MVQAKGLLHNEESATSRLASALKSDGAMREEIAAQNGPAEFCADAVDHYPNERLSGKKLIYWKRSSQPET